MSRRREARRQSRIRKKFWAAVCSAHVKLLDREILKSFGLAAGEFQDHTYTTAVAAESSNVLTIEKLRAAREMIEGPRRLLCDPEPMDETLRCPPGLKESWQAIYGPKFCKHCEKVQPIRVYELAGTRKSSFDGSCLTLSFDGSRECAVCHTRIEDK